MKKTLIIAALLVLAVVVWLSNDEAIPTVADSAAKPTTAQKNGKPADAGNSAPWHNATQSPHIGAVEPIITSNRPTHGEALLEVLKMERGGTQAVLQLQTSLIAHLRQEQNPSAEQLKALRDAEEMMPGLQEKLARQSAEIDRFDVNAGPPDESPERGPKVAVQAILNADDKALERAFADRFNDASAMKPEVKQLLIELNRNLATAQVPEAMVPSVRNMLVNLVATSRSMADLPNRDLAAHTMAENKAAFVQAVQAISSGKQR